MANNANDVISVFKSWLGAKEGGATHRAILAIYNGHRPLPRSYAVKTTDSWCATAVSAAFIKAGALDAIKGGVECSCDQMIKLAKGNGLWQEDGTVTPSVGDIIMYNWGTSRQPNNGPADHVGVVVAVSGGAMTVIEGNKSDSVAYRHISVGNGYIRGFIKPRYSSPSHTQNAPQAPNIDAMAHDVINGKYGSGDARKRALGANYAAVQARVNQLLKGGSQSPSSYYPRYAGTSSRIDTVFATIGAPCGNWKKRRPVAQANGISGYTGTASQNTKLITLARQGRLRR